MAQNIPKPPAGLERAGRALWRAVQRDYELEEHERSLLLEACRTADALDRLQTTLDADGVMAESSQGVRVHPALPELRQQRIAFARLLAALQIPVGDEDARPGRRQYGVRGLYGVKGGAS